MKINVHVFPEYEGPGMGHVSAWMAVALEIDYVTQGDTPEEAIKMFLEGLSLNREVRHDRGLPADELFEPAHVEGDITFWNTMPEEGPATTPGGER